MTEIRTNRFTLSIHEFASAERTSKRRFPFTARLKGSSRLVLVALVFSLLVVSPLILAGILLPSERPGIVPSFLAAIRQLVWFYFWPFFLLFWVGGVLSPTMRRLQMRQSNTKYYENTELSFRHEGLDLSRPDVHSHFDWPYFQSVLDSKEFLLLYYGKDSFLPIPKRAVTPTEIPALVELLRSHINVYQSIS